MDLTFIDRALVSGIPYITYAVPVFFPLIGVEPVVAEWERKSVYRLHDAISDLSCSSTDQIVSILLKGLLFAGYQGTYATATRSGINLIDVASHSAGGKWLAAIFLFLGVDGAYYWFHPSRIPRSTRLCKKGSPNVNRLIPARARRSRLGSSV
jgi:hypothetical protein